MLLLVHLVAKLPTSVRIETFAVITDISYSLRELLLTNEES